MMPNPQLAGTQVLKFKEKPALAINSVDVIEECGSRSTWTAVMTGVELKALSQQEIFDAVEKAYPWFQPEGSQCGCEHDCCGCVQYQSATLELHNDHICVVTQSRVANY